MTELQMYKEEVCTKPVGGNTDIERFIKISRTDAAHSRRLCTLVKFYDANDSCKRLISECSSKERYISIGISIPVSFTCSVYTTAICLPKVTSQHVAKSLRFSCLHGYQVKQSIESLLALKISSLCPKTQFACELKVKTYRKYAFLHIPLYV